MSNKLQSTKSIFMPIYYKVKIVCIAFTCFAGISLFFIFSDGVSNFVARFIKIAPSFTGGEVVAHIVDTLGDDCGASGETAIKYPLSKAFEKGSLDLVRYTVCEPVTNARWQESAEYWQLALEYKSGSQATRNIMIYIDLDNIEKSEGSTETLFDAVEKVIFQEEHAWDFAIWISGESGKVYDNEKKIISDVDLYFLNGGSKIKIRIPLKDKRLQKIFGAKKTYHYILTGAYSQFDRGGFMPLESKATLSRGGMKNRENYNSLIPPVYDVLGDNAMLATWNAETFEKAVLSPTEVSMTQIKNQNSNDETKAFVTKVKAMYENYLLAYQGAQEMNIGGDIERALAHYENKLKANPDDYVSMAYYGSYLAMKGGESSVMKAVALVNEAYTYLDKACTLAYEKDGEIDVLMNRASVSASVPESVFGKAETGAEDFLRVAFLTDERVLKAYCYVMAYECYEKCEKESDAFLALQEAGNVLK